MGQKILAYLFYGFLILMGIAALILLKYQLDHKDIKQQQIDSRANVVSHSEKDSHSSQKTITDKTTKPKQSADNATLEADQKLHQEEAGTLSYLDIYRQLNQAKTCQPIFLKWQSDGSKADLESLISKPYTYYGDPIYQLDQKPPITTAQKQLLQQWKDQCLNLWRLYGKYTPDLQDNQFLNAAIAENIERRLNSALPTTKREQAIKQVLKFTKQWQLRFTELEQALTGENSLTEAEIADIHSQMEQLSDEQFQIIADSQTAQNNSNLTDQIARINQQISELNNILMQQKVKNPDTIEQAKAAFKSIDQQLFKQFYTGYGEVFYEALKTVVGHNNLRYIGSGYSAGGQAGHQRITPVNMVLEANNLRTNIWHRETVNSATLLYLCNLGIDCTATSELMIDYCLTDYFNYPSGCGLTVQEFLRQQLISPNQWSDVQRIKNSYREIFNG